MKKINTLMVLFMASIGLFNQLNAQIPDSILIKKFKNFIERPESNNQPNELSIFGVVNAPTVQKVKLKAAQECQELLDSSVFFILYDGEVFGGQKLEMGYDVDGNQIFESAYSWDSEINDWQGSRKEYPKYNANGDLIMQILDTWDKETRQWVQDGKNEWTYDADGNVILYAVFYWNSETCEWEWHTKNESTHTYTADNVHINISITSMFDAGIGEWIIHHRNEQHFDLNGKMTFYNAMFLDSISNNWVFDDRSFKYERAYDENGNQTLSSYYEWDSGLNQWVGSVYSYLTEWTFDENGNETMIVFKKWDETMNQWMNSTKTESGYNANGLKLENTTYEWNSSNDDWLALKQTENTYNEDGTLSKEINAEWDNEKMLWVSIAQREFSYDAQGNLSQTNNLQVDSISGEWYVYAKDEYAYNADNNVILKESFTLNNDDEWMLYSKMESIYDVYGNLSSSKLYDEDDEGILNSQINYTYNKTGDKLIEELNEIGVKYYYEDTLYEFSMGWKTNYYYSMHCANSVIDVRAEATSIYPNPFSDQLFFNLKDNYNQIIFELFDLQGRKLMSTPVLNSQTISTKNLDNGVYIYNLSLDGKMQSGRLIKK